MDSKSLMIGDWVNFYPSPLAQNGIYYDRVIVLDRYDVECEPIPLTTEILEKNGLVYKRLEKGYDGYVINIDSYSTLFLFSLTKTTDDAYTWGIEDMPINYVHELQHALRLCGLNELADNFKVWEE